MWRRRLAMTLLELVLAIAIAFSPMSGMWADGVWADQSDDEAEETEQPARTAPATPEPARPEQAQVQAPTGNNIIGLNVARLRRERYVAAASELANANGGDWGYLTVVFTSTERDSAVGEQLLQELLDLCYLYRLQPIIRVATSFDPGAEVWSRPTDGDAERWRTFLEKGRWPTKHVWLIAGNEPNLGREWGGEVDSASYAAYLSHFLDVFQDQGRFKVVNGPLDASNTSEMPKMQDAYEFLDGMEAAVPGIFGRLSGWASNPYSVPNHGPGLRYTHRAYEAELEAIGRDMPVLITEAGHLNTGDEKEIAAFYEDAFRDWAADSRVVAVTPLFWHPDRGVYWMFDFSSDGKIIEKSPTYELMLRLPRMRGSPEYETDVENVARAPATRPAAGATGTSALGPRPGVADRRDADSRASTDTRASDEVIRPPLRIANTDGQGARLRAEPSRTAKSLTVVPDGVRVDSIGPSERHGDLTWRQVRLPDGTEGWIATDFLVPAGRVE